MLSALRATVAILLGTLSTAPATAQTLISATAIPGAPQGAQAFAIKYHSISFDGRPNEVTGLLIEPDGESNSRPIIAWTHGTTGISERCTPSNAAGRFAQIAGLSDMLKRGWVVVAPDYAGLGSPGPHPYLVADATAHAVIDAVRAARDHPSAKAGSKFGVWGLSQGGHAALVTGAAAKDFAPELTLVGVAAAAPPTDLRANFGHAASPTARGVLMAFVAASWSQVYGASFATLNLPGKGRLLMRLSQICALGQKAKLGTLVGAVAAGRALQKVDVPNIEPWRDLLVRNSARPEATSSAPLLIAQSPKDEIVSPAVTLKFARAACRAHAQVRWLVAPDADHGSTAEQTSSQTVSWLADRFEDKPPPSDCGKF